MDLNLSEAKAFQIGLNNALKSSDCEMGNLATPGVTMRYALYFHLKCF